ncbi:TetR/AcrR family transcriptional regulator C-terminal domain-containing protein [Nocardioides bigeumensis]|uniref:TetR/AcrR family transcriptional regulator C-terminal domain-containing protein n=1 Tax=Nocardioides bigeumensis TaxID=433657 RepID=A0ABP5KG01_9ACTN
MRPTGPLTRDDIVTTAMGLADRHGLAKLSMRSLARELGVEAMSLYHHVAHKEALLDGMVDHVFSEFHAPRPGHAWADEMRRRAVTARESLLRHPWAIGLMDSRTSPGEATLRHHDAVIGCLRAAGFSVELAAHAFALLDAHVYGHALQEVALPFEPGDDIAPIAEAMLASMPTDTLPHLAEMAREHIYRPGYTFGAEMTWGLELLLAGLADRLADRLADESDDLGGS